MSDCIFCKIINKEILAPIVYEDDFSLAFLDIAPTNPGHTLLIPKKHYSNLYEMPDELLAKFAPNIKKLSIAVKKGVSADGINIIINNEPAAGQIIFHHHTHIVPRFEGDGFKHWPGKPYENKEKEKEVLNKIKSALA